MSQEKEKNANEIESLPLKRRKFTIPSLAEIESVRKAPPSISYPSRFQTSQNQSTTTTTSSSSSTIPKPQMAPLVRSRTIDLQSAHSSSSSSSAPSSSPSSSSSSSSFSSSSLLSIKPKPQRSSSDPNLHALGKSSSYFLSSSSSCVPKVSKPTPSLPSYSSHWKIIVSMRQKGNRLMKYFRNVGWEFGQTKADFQVSDHGVILFLSLKYHLLYPQYIFSRIKGLEKDESKDGRLRVMLVHVDVVDCGNAIRNLCQICLIGKMTLILAWSLEETARYIETFKAYQKKGPDLIQEKLSSNLRERAVDCLTTIKFINKTDATTLLSMFGSLASIMQASMDELLLVPGIGEAKVRRLYKIFHDPFVEEQKKL